MKELLIHNIKDSITAKQELLNQEDCLECFALATEYLLQQYRQGGRLYIAGNGGSAADAQHLAAEFVSKLAKDRPALAAEALTVDSSILTAIGNDYGYDYVFSRQIEGKMTEKDVLLAITTSGESPNIIKALKTCRERGILTILFSGKGGGAAKELADYPIIVPGVRTSTIQELHIILAHSLCEAIETSIFNEV